MGLFNASSNNNINNELSYKNNSKNFNILQGENIKKSHKNICEKIQNKNNYLEQSGVNLLEKNTEVITKSITKKKNENILQDNNLRNILSERSSNKFEMNKQNWSQRNTKKFKLN